MSKNYIYTVGSKNEMVFGVDPGGSVKTPGRVWIPSAVIADGLKWWDCSWRLHYFDAVSVELFPFNVGFYEGYCDSDISRLSTLRVPAFVSWPPYSEMNKSLWFQWVVGANNRHRTWAKAFRNTIGTRVSSFPLPCCSDLEASSRSCNNKMTT